MNTLNLSPDGRFSEQSECDYRDVFTEASRAVVLVETYNESRFLAQGAGWVYRVNESTAHVVTNWHVAYHVRGSTATKPTNYSVQFAEGRWRSAELVAADNATDVAVLEVDDPPAATGQLRLARTPPEPGQPMVVVGSPLGFQNTVTSGVVGGVDRVSTVRYSNQYRQTMTDLVQSGAAVTRGNSGGPWVNCRGNVIGMSIAGVPRTDVDFAVSMPVLETVLPVLLENRTYRHSQLGVETVTVTPRLAAANEFDVTRGVMVTDVSSNGPAAGRLRGAPYVHEETGLPAGGDVIRAIDGAPVADEEDLLTHLLLETGPNETVNLSVLRDGEIRTVQVTLGLRPTNPPRPQLRRDVNKTTPTPDEPNATAADEALTVENVTFETLRLQNTTLRNVTVADIEGNVTVGASARTASARRLTADRVAVTNATLRNVTFERLTLRNEPLLTSFFGEVRPANGTENMTVRTATVANATVHGVTIDGMDVADGTVGNVTRRATARTGDGGTQAPAMKATGMSVESGTVVRVTISNASVDIVLAADRTARLTPPSPDITNEDAHRSQFRNH